MELVELNQNRSVGSMKEWKCRSELRTKLYLIELDRAKLNGKENKLERTNSKST